ncbi:hypothetical protein C464_10059 [Halorubrum coriense DSM 10284]|uniref:GCN5-related N-acetyltransferase n=1 Tax=Halorubrum coriense DSM 10284 TaxID=1227466 RepID=M0EGV9_9EURY|nr:hypothetical protein [Halorubrum coriense]ELZ46991.1 hypothetical protein C464_10059 [Halorubrum coriense DSM 10284]
MGQETLNGVDISELRATYDRKVREELPARATDDWPIRADHCFARVVLDNVFGGPWDEHVSGRPAYERLSVAELEAAVEIADVMLAEGRPAVERYDENSLRWRGER